MGIAKIISRLEVAMGNSVEFFMVDKQQPHPEHALESLFRVSKSKLSHSMPRFLQMLAVASLLAVAACASLPGSESGNRQVDASFSAIPAGVGIFGGR